MSKLGKMIDPWFLLLVAMIGAWWLAASNVRTPQSEIASLEETHNPYMWLAALASTDREVREYAGENMLDRLPADDIGPIAIEAAQSDNAAQRIAGLQFLAQADVEGAGETAIGFLDDSNPEIRRAALNVLAHDPLPYAHPEIAELTRASDPGIQAAALRALGALENPDDLPLFISFLGASSSDIRDAAGNAIVALAPQNPEVVPSLMGAAQGADLAAAREALSLLGDIGGDDALNGLFAFMEYGPVALASDAATAIGKIGGEEAGERALQIYITADTRIRTQAARVLGALGATEARDYLWAAVTDETGDFWVRYHSLGALATCGDGDLAGDVIDFLESDDLDPRLVRIGVEALGGMDGDAVLELFDAMISGETDLGLNRSGGNTSLVAVIAGLGRMDNDESRRRLRSLLQSTDRDNLEIVMSLIRALAKVGTIEDVETLRRLPEEDPILRGVIAEALQHIEERDPATRDTDDVSGLLRNTGD